MDVILAEKDSLRNLWSLSMDCFDKYVFSSYSIGVFMDERFVPRQPDQNVRATTAIETRAYAKRPLDVFNITEKEPMKKRSPEEVEELKRKIGLIARVFSRNYAMDVYPSPDGGWSCGFAGGDEIMEEVEKFMAGEVPNLDHVAQEKWQPKRIHYDVKDIEEGMSEDQVLGVMRHEIGHAKNTDFKLLIEGQKMALDEGYLPSSYAQGWNSCEDPWVNNKEIGDSETVREKMTDLYRKWLPETRDHINTQPASHQLGLNIIHYWLTNESIPTLKDKEVLDLFDGIRSAVDEYFEADTPAESQKVFREKIWNTFKKLEKKSIEQEKQKEMMRRASGSTLGGEQGGGAEGKGQGEEQSMIDKIRQKLGLGKSKGKQGGQPQGQLQPGGTGGETDPKTKEEIKKEMERQEKAAKARKEKRDKEVGSDEELPEDIDLTDVPPELLKKIQEAIDALTPEQKKELEKKATEALDKKQADAANKKMPKGIQMEKDPDTGKFIPKVATSDKKKDDKVKKAVDDFNTEEDKKADQRARQEAEAEALREAEGKAEEAKKREAEQMRKDGFGPEEQDLYRYFKQLEQQMEGHINGFMRAMERYVPKKEETAYGGEAQYAGHKLSKRDVVKRAPLKDYRIQLRRQVVESEEPRLYIELLIDNSGSMRGQKMEESVKTAIFLARVLKRFEIPFGIKFFGDHVAAPMKLGDDYDDARKKIKPNVLKEGNASGLSTDMASPLFEAMDEMTAAKRKFVGCHGGVFIISDSGANSGPLTGSALGNYIKEKQKTFSILNFLLSDSAAELAAAQRLFGVGNVVQASDFGNLPSEAFKILRIVLERVLKTFRSS